MSAALALLGQAPGRKFAVLGDMLEMGEGGIDLHKALVDPILANHVDLVFCCGDNMQRMYWDLPAPQHGAWTETSDGLVDSLMRMIKPGDTVLVKGSNGSKMSVIIEALRKRGA